MVNITLLIKRELYTVQGYRNLGVILEERMTETQLGIMGIGYGPERALWYMKNLVGEARN